MNLNEQLIQEITKQVIACITSQQHAVAVPLQTPASGGNVFETVDEAVAAARTAYRELAGCTLDKRGQFIEAIKQKIHQNVNLLVEIELEETGFGRYEHKLQKHLVMLEKTPGVESVMPEIVSGDLGMSIIEYRAFGVAALITPSTAPSATVIHNAMCMIASGNTAVVSPHPGAYRTSIRAARLVNDAIVEAGGPANIITILSCATIENANTLMRHDGINLIVATGGPDVVKAALSSGKKAIGAGAGNPPVLVDETADIPKAANCIIAGNSNENGINCLGEKAVIAVASVADQLMSEMERSGGYRLRNPADIDRLTKLLTLDDGTPNRKFVGKNASLILGELGIEVTDSCRSIFFEADRSHPIVMEEYLMPVLPLVRVRDFEEGTELAVKIEDGRRHTAVIHSKNIDHMARYAKKLATTILVKNGSSFNGAGIEGEGHMSLTLAGPTGEGITTPRSFTRPMRCALVGNIGLRGAL